MYICDDVCIEVLPSGVSASSGLRKKSFASGCRQLEWGLIIKWVVCSTLNARPHTLKTKYELSPPRLYDKKSGCGWGDAVECGSGCEPRQQIESIKVGSRMVRGVRWCCWAVKCKQMDRLMSCWTAVLLLSL